PARLVPRAGRWHPDDDRGIAGEAGGEDDRTGRASRYGAVGWISRAAAIDRPAHAAVVNGVRRRLRRARVALERRADLESIPQREIAIELEPVLVRNRRALAEVLIERPRLVAEPQRVRSVQGRRRVGRIHRAVDVDG